MYNKLRIIYMGSPGFAIEPLKGLFERHDIIAVVTQPDKPKGRGLKLQACPVKQWALEHDLPVFTPLKVKDPEFLKKLRELSPDLIVVCAYGKILPKEVLEIPKHGCWNIHASLLPKYRGAAPINWAIIRGEKETGITIMLMDEGMDTGPILLQKAIPIEEEDTSITLAEKLSKLGKDAILEAIELFFKGEISPTPQSEEGVCYAPLLKKEDGFFTFDSPAIEIERKVRGLLPWPVAHTSYKNKLLKIFDAKVKESSSKDVPGKVLDVNEEGILVQCNPGSILLKELQLAGKKRLKALEFARGQRLKPGDLLH